MTRQTRSLVVSLAAACLLCMCPREDAQAHEPQHPRRTPDEATEHAIGQALTETALDPRVRSALKQARTGNLARGLSQLAQRVVTDLNDDGDVVKTISVPGDGREDRVQRDSSGSRSRLGCREGVSRDQQHLVGTA